MVQLEPAAPALPDHVEGAALVTVPGIPTYGLAASSTIVGFTRKR